MPALVSEVRAFTNFATCPLPSVAALRLHLEQRRGVGLRMNDSRFGAWLRSKKRRASEQAGEALVLSFPWSQVKKLAPDERGWALHVKRSVFNTESLHFQLSGSADALAEALRARQSK